MKIRTPFVEMSKADIFALRLLVNQFLQDNENTKNEELYDIILVYKQTKEKLDNAIKEIHKAEREERK